MIKNYFFKAMLAVAVCGTAVLGGCSKDSNDAPKPDDTIIAKSAYFTYTKGEAAANYYLKLSTAELNTDGKAKGAGDVYYFDLYSALPLSGAVRMPAAGTYTLDASDSEAVGTMGSISSFKEPYTMVNNTPTPGDMIDFTAAKIVVAQSGDTFSAVAELTLKTGEVVKIKAENIAGITPSNELEQDVEMMPAAAMGAFIPLNESNLSGYALALNSEDETEQIQLLFTAPRATFKDGLPEGPFLIEEREALEAGYAIPGGPDENGKSFGCYYANKDGVIGYLIGGEILIEKGEAEGTYYISVMGETTNGKMVMAEFEGEVSLESGAISTLTGDHAITFTHTTAKAHYYGNSLGNNLGCWRIALNPNAASKEGLEIKLLVASTTSITMPTGEFTIQYKDEAQTAIPGSVNKMGLIHTLYYKYGATADAVSEFAAMTAGTIKIEASGNNYVFTINGVDDNGNSITGSWTGPVTVSKGEVSTSSASKVKALRPAHGQKISANAALKRGMMSQFLRK